MKKLAMLALVITLGCSVSFAADGREGSEKTIEKEFKTEKGKTLTVNLETGGSLKITGWDKETVSIKASIDGEDWEDCKFDFEEKDNGVLVTSHYDGDKNSWSSDCRLEIMVPNKYNLSLSTMGGGIKLDNIEGELKGKTMGGSLKLSNLKGTLDLKTMGGGISLENSDVDGEVETMGGQVTVNEVTGSVDVHSMSGSVHLKKH